MLFAKDAQSFPRIRLCAAWRRSQDLSLFQSFDKRTCQAKRATRRCGTMSRQHVIEPRTISGQDFKILLLQMAQKNLRTETESLVPKN